MAPRTVLTKTERERLAALSSVIRALAACLRRRAPTTAASAESWFRYLAAVKKAQGNMHMQLSFLACLMAKAYLGSHHSVNGLDVAAKPQGAPGLDFDFRTRAGRRLIAELKTTVPYEADDFGAAQWSALERDFAKLRRQRAYAKYLFVTDPQSFTYLRQSRGSVKVPGLRIVLLPGGRSFVV